MTSLDAIGTNQSALRPSDALLEEPAQPRAVLDEVLVSRPTELFLQSRSVGSPRTVEWYRDSLRDFYRITARRPEDATEEDLIAYFAKTQSENRWRALRTYFHFIYARKLVRGRKNPMIAYDPATGRGILKPKRAHRVVRIVTPDEMQKLLHACTKGRQGLRDRASLLFLYDVGARCCEISLVRIRDLNFMEYSVVLHGKGSRDRKVFFGKKTALALQRHIANLQDVTPDKLVFETNQRQPYNHHSMGDVLERVCRRSNIRRCGPHLLRHTFAVNLWNATKRIEVVQRALGHADIQTTFEYLVGLGVDMVDLQSVMTSNSAADRL